MKILVVGSASFLGYALSKRLLELGHNIYGIDDLDIEYETDIKQYRNNDLIENPNYNYIKLPKHNEGLLSLLKGEKVDYVYDLDSKEHIYNFGGTHTYSDFLEKNVVESAKIFELAATLGAKKFFCASTHSVYGQTKKIKLTEKKVQPKPISPHGASKLAEEKVVEFLSAYYNLNSVIFRVFTAYGPYMNPYTVIWKFMEELHSGKRDILVQTSLKSTRDYIYITDVVNYFISAMDKRIKFQIINIASGENQKLEDVAKIIAKYMNIDPNTVKVSQEHADFSKLLISKEQKADIVRAIRMLKYKPQTSFEEGIRNTVDWYISNNLFNQKIHN